MATKKDIQEVEVLSKLVKAYRTIVEVSGDEDELRYANKQIQLNEACIKSIEKKSIQVEKEGVFEFEVALSVSDYDGDFESCKDATDDALIAASDELLILGADVMQEDIHRVAMDAKFIEFDSSNPSHAEGYFAVTVTGPKELVKKIGKFWTG